jgi:hypothetical protein
MDRARSTTAWAIVLTWCAACGYFAFMRAQSLPLVSSANLGFHELGHLIMYIIPINQLLTAAMGSIMQCAVPLGLAAYFCWWRKDAVGLAACLAWASTNIQEASVYIADAPYEELELIGGEHDWAYVLGSEGLNRLQDAAGIASTVRGIGVLVLLVACVLAMSGLVNALRTSDVRTPGPIRVAPRETTPDDLWPTTSRTPSSDPARRSRRW